MKKRASAVLIIASVAVPGLAGAVPFDANSFYGGLNTTQLGVSGVGSGWSTLLSGFNTFLQSGGLNGSYTTQSGLYIGLTPGVNGGFNLLISPNTPVATTPEGGTLLLLGAGLLGLTLLRRHWQQSPH